MPHMTRSTSKRSKGAALGLGVGVRRRLRLTSGKKVQGNLG